MSENVRQMVLRSVNLPPEMDEQLRRLAFLLRCPKADLIRFFINRGLRELIERVHRDQGDETINSLIADLQSDASVAEKKLYAQDFLRLEQTIRRREEEAAAAGL